MKEIVRIRLTRRRKVRPYQGRGPIYAWLRAHHASIEKLGPTRPCIWAELALDMSEDRVVDGTGDPPTANNIRMTWQRVCRDVAAEAAAARPKRVPPSRISPDWRPTVVPPPPIRAAPAVAGNTPPPPSNDPRAPSRDPDMTPEGQAVLDRIWADLLADDRKKFGHQG
jgi:hypothetical protein